METTKRTQQKKDAQQWFESLLVGMTDERLTTLLKAIDDDAAYFGLEFVDAIDAYGEKQQRLKRKGSSQAKEVAQ